MEKELREPCVQKKRETTRVRTPGPLIETVKVGTLVLLKQTAREWTQEPSKSQWKRWRVQKKRKEKKKKKNKKNKKVQEKQFVEKGERKNCKLSCGEVERRSERQKK